MIGSYPELSAKCGEARNALREHMGRHGLLEGDGWRIYEFTRQVGGRTELVLRPVHSRLTAPEELECTCHLEGPSQAATAECSQ